MAREERSPVQKADYVIVAEYDTRGGISGNDAAECTVRYVR